jgi:acyl dehydratase
MIATGAPYPGHRLNATTDDQLGRQALHHLVLLIAAAITMRLLVEGGLPLAGGVIGAGGELDWPNPTRPGDTLQVESEVLEVRPSRSRPDRGVATVRSLTRNQRNEVVQRLTAKLIVARRV